MTGKPIVTILRNWRLVLGLALAAPVMAQEQPSGLIARAELRAHGWLEMQRTREGAELAPFTTDGCSGGMSATWSMVAALFPEFAEVHMETPPWEGCCVAHDRAYHLGGEDPAPDASYDARLTADEMLRQCVRDTAELRREQLKQEYGLTDQRIDQAYDLISASMFDAVRTGGGPCSGLPWRWGYGWPQCGLFAD